MRLATRTIAIAGGLLTALLAAGCGAHAPSGQSAATGNAEPGSAGGVTAQVCADYGVYAIEHRITVTRTPAACHGLSKAEISQAAAVAILRVAGGERKAMWRRRAAEVAPFVDRLITAPTPAAASLPAAAGWPAAAPAAGHPSGKDLAMDIAALAAWLVTAGSGAYVLLTWISGGGSLRHRADPSGGADAATSGSPPSVILAHFGLALAGLVLWASYLAVGWPALAWTAVCMLLPVAGLGMATLTIGLPGRLNAARDADADTAHGIADAPAGSVAGTAVLVVRPHPVRARLAPFIVVFHGLLAVTTMLLVLLAALGRPTG